MSPINVDDVQREILQRLLDSRLLRIIPLPTPAAGAEPASVTVPGGVVWDFRTWFGILATSAVVANRLPRLTFSDGTTTWSQIASQAAIAASQNGKHTFVADIGATVSGTINGLATPLPRWALPAGTMISHTTLSIDVADQWTGLCLTVYEYSAAQVEQQADWINDAILDQLGSGGLG